MTDKDQNIKNTDSTVEPELLGVELSEELKKTGSDIVQETVPSQTVESSPVETTEKVKKKEYDVEIKSQEVIPNVPKKEFSLPEQSRQIEEILDNYIPNPSLANSSR